MDTTNGFVEASSDPKERLGWGLMAEFRYRRDNPFYAELIEIHAAYVKEQEEQVKKKRDYLRPYAIHILGGLNIHLNWLKANRHRLPKNRDGNSTFINKDGSEVRDSNGNKLFDEMWDYGSDMITREIDRLIALPEIPPVAETWLKKHYEREAFEKEQFDACLKDEEFIRLSNLQGQGLMEGLSHFEKEYNRRVKPCDLYRYYGNDGELLYIGISNRSLIRAYEHSKNSRWFDNFAFMEREVCLSRNHALAAEKEAIQTENPLFNKVHALSLGVAA